MIVRKLLTIGHSYCVTFNRRLGYELARAGGNRWLVTVAGPSFFSGDLRPITMFKDSNEPCNVIGIKARHTSRIHLMTYGRALKDLMRQEWDVVHAWEEPYILSGGQIALNKPSGAKLVYATFQNLEKTYPPPFSWVERFSMERADGWIAFANLVDRTLSSRAIYSSRPHRTIPVGVDTDAFRPDRDRRLATLQRLGWQDDGTCVIGFLGRLVPEKGIRMLMRVLERIRLPWRTIFIGTGPLEAEIRGWMLHHKDRVRLVTSATHDQVPALLNGCDLMVAPSQTTPKWQEQFGRMLLEGMASGVPVLGSDSGEIPFVLGDAGIVISESDETIWETTIRMLIENVPMRCEYVERGRERVLKQFAWPIVAQRHLDFFEELI